MNLLLDPTFYLFLSFLTFVVLSIWKFRSKVLFYFQKKIETISTDLNQAACEKDEALLAYTRANTTLAQLPDDVARIWEEASVDLSPYEEQLEQEIEKIVALNETRLQLWKEQLIRKEYDRGLEKLSRQFRNDALKATPPQKEALVDQSLDLLDELITQGISS